MENYISLAPGMKDGGQLLYRECMCRVLRKVTMFCRSTHLKDKQVLTNGDTISSTVRMCTKGFRLQSEVKVCLVIYYNSYTLLCQTKGSTLMS